METFIVRMWLPDRPGALGAVASRIGAVRGDVVGIDILERGAGRAIDELVVELPDANLVSLLLSEVNQVDGVDVEDVRPAVAARRDARLDALDTAALLVETSDRVGLLGRLVACSRKGFEADWAAAIDVESRDLVASEGAAPPPEWLAAFVAGCQSSAAAASGDHGPDDAACALLGRTSLAVVLGRQGRPFRARERYQLAALARIAGVRASELDAPALTEPRRADLAAPARHPLLAAD